MWQQIRFFIKNSRLINSSNNLRKFSTHSQKQNERIDFYMKELNDEKFALIQMKNKNLLQQKISTILQQFDYHMYANNLSQEIFENDVQLKNRYDLKPDELFQILLHIHDNDYIRLIDYYVKNRCQLYHKYMNKLSTIKENENDNENRSGIWSDSEAWPELRYGLWHNCLFTKIKRSSLSRLYHRRITNNQQFCPSTPRLWLDLNYVNNDFFKTRKLLNDLRDVLSFNKYHTNNPFRIEFICSDYDQLMQNVHFKNNVENFFEWWNQDIRPYAFYCLKKPETLLKTNEKLIYFLPNAKKSIKISEILDEANIFVIPCYYSKDLRDTRFQQIIKQLKHNKSILIRRLPTNEHIVWNKFHGVISWKLFFEILDDIRNNVETMTTNNNNDWHSIFKRHLSKNELIKSDEELRLEMMNRQMLHQKRQKQVENFRKEKRH